MDAGVRVLIMTWRPAGILLGRVGPMATSLLVGEYHCFEGVVVLEMGAWDGTVDVAGAVVVDLVVAVLDIIVPLF